MKATHCPNCGIETNCGTSPHVDWQECALCTRWRARQERDAQIIAWAWYATLAALVGALVFLCGGGGGR